MKALLPHSRTFRSYLASRFISVSIVNLVRQYLRAFSFLLDSAFFSVSFPMAPALTLSLASNLDSTDISFPSCSYSVRVVREDKKCNIYRLKVIFVTIPSREHHTSA